MVRVCETAKMAVRRNFPMFSVISQPNVFGIEDLLALSAGDQRNFLHQVADELSVADDLSDVSLELVLFSHEELRRSIDRNCHAAIP